MVLAGADMQRFAMALMNEDSPLFERPGTHSELLSPSNCYGDTDTGSNYHGFWRNVFYNGTVIGHLGGTAGWSSALWIEIEKKECIAVMTNQHEETRFTDGLPELVFERYEGELPEFSGIVQAAQTVCSGPLKMQRLFVTQPLIIGNGTILLENTTRLERGRTGTNDETWGVNNGSPLNISGNGHLMVTGGVTVVGQGWTKTTIKQTTSGATARCATVSGGARLEGVTLTGGRLTEGWKHGAGVDLDGGKVSWCRITDNQ